MHGPRVGACRVCGDMTDTFSNAVCLQCGGPFHLALRQDVPTKDCGQVWIGEETQALEFACDICLGRVDPAAQRSETSHQPYARNEGRRASDILREKRAGRNRRGS